MVKCIKAGDGVCGKLLSSKNIASVSKSQQKIATLGMAAKVCG